jgi:hypothetical protein
VKQKRLWVEVLEEKYKDDAIKILALEQTFWTCFKSLLTISDCVSFQVVSYDRFETGRVEVRVMLKKKAWKDYEGDQKNNSGVGLCLHVAS